MCFEIKKKYSEPKIATSDIEVYKTNGETSFFGLFFRPGFMSEFVYFLNRPTKKVIIKPFWFQGIDTPGPYNKIGNIEEGYHSYNQIGIGSRFSGCGICKVYKFIIPQGTLYFENEIECVSERLIYKGTCKISDKEAQFLKEKCRDAKKARIQEEKTFYGIEDK